MPSLSRDQILSASDLPLVCVEIPEWSGSVHVRPLTALERDGFENRILKLKAGGQTLSDCRGLIAGLVEMACCDAAGVRLFADGDAVKLQAKNAKAVGRIYDAIREASGMTDAAAEEIRKNLEAVPSGNSHTG